jgi:hypothetical protein
MPDLSSMAGYVEAWGRHDIVGGASGKEGHGDNPCPVYLTLPPL